MAILANWRCAVKAAEVDADRYLGSAKLRARELLSELRCDSAITELNDIVSGILQIADVDELPSTTTAVLAVPLPLPMSFEELPRPSFPAIATTQSQNTHIAVAFTSFLLDGLPFSEPQTIEPGVLHDLTVEVSVSQWPQTAGQLLIEPLSVEPASTYGLPTFSIRRPSGGPPFVIQQAGRILLKCPLSFLARPLEFKYRARFFPDAAEWTILIQGQRCLRVQSFDPMQCPESGYVQIDQKLLEIRDQARLVSAIRDSELNDFLLFMAAVAGIAGQALQDNRFKAIHTEATFQNELKMILRSNGGYGHEIGGTSPCWWWYH